MKRLFATLCLLCVATSFSFAFAAGTAAKLTWVNPTQYTDSKALPIGDIAYLTILACEVDSPAICITQKVNSSNGTVPTSAVVPVVCGQYNFTITVTTTAKAVHPNITSGPSNIAPFASGVSCSPKAVTDLTAS
jgi:hypothetical protein